MRWWEPEISRLSKPSHFGAVTFWIFAGDIDDIHLKTSLVFLEEHPPLNLFRGPGDPSFFGTRNHDSFFFQIHNP
jgi:hypothetical protein